MLLDRGATIPVPHDVKVVFLTNPLVKVVANFPHDLKVASDTEIPFFYGKHVLPVIAEIPSTNPSNKLKSSGCLCRFFLVLLLLISLMPHPSSGQIKKLLIHQCSCEECLTASGEDSLRYSLARLSSHNLCLLLLLLGSRPGL